MSTPPEAPGSSLAKAAGAGRKDTKASDLAAAAAGADETKDPLWEFRERALNYLNSVWKGDSTCPVCKTDTWYVANIAVLPIRRGDVGTPAGGDAFPLVPVTCETCGYTFFLNEQWVRADGTPWATGEGKS
jgi:hypothetical protein